MWTSVPAMSAVAAGTFPAISANPEGTEFGRQSVGPGTFLSATLTAAFFPSTVGGDDRATITSFSPMPPPRRRRSSWANTTSSRAAPTFTSTRRTRT